MRLAAMLPRAREVLRGVSAFDALRMATWEGMRAIGLDGTEGLAAGARADFAILDPEAGWSLPDDWSEEPYGAIVFSMGPQNVHATVVDGVVRYRANDPTVGGLKPAVREIRDAVRKMRSRM
jgi:cytosine/adenosine deaminase-related metal-dependent hydrolase